MLMAYKPHIQTKESNGVSWYVEFVIKFMNRVTLKENSERALSRTTRRELFNFCLSTCRDNIILLCMYTHELTFPKSFNYNSQSLTH